MEPFSSFHTSNLKEKIEEFVATNSNPKAPVDIDYDEQVKIWCVSHEVLSDVEIENFHILAIKALKVLSRNPQILKNYIKRETIELLLSKAGINTIGDEESVRKGIKDLEMEIIVESLYCLSNMYLQSRELDVLKSLEVNIVSGIAVQAKQYKEMESPLSLVSLDMRLLTIITCQSKESRDTLYLDHDGVNLLIHVLSNSIEETKQRTLNAKEEEVTARGTTSNSHNIHDQAILNEVEVTAIINTINVLSNCLTSVDFDENDLDENLKASLNKICRILYLLFTYEKETTLLTSSIKRATIQLLASFPYDQFASCLIPKIDCGNEPKYKFQLIKYEGVFMDIPNDILNYFMHIFKAVKNASLHFESSKDGFFPVLKV